MNRFNLQRGFTLAELTVVLIIVGLLLGGMLIPLGAQTDIRYRSDTAKALTDIREALIGYAIVNGRLPCPADRSIATATTNAGAEAVSAVGGPCACTSATSGIAVATGGAACSDTTPGSVTGVLPWATLGLPETDAWGNRFTYRVTTRFGRIASGQTTFGSCTPGSNPAATAFALCSAGDITVYTNSALTTTVASGIPAIVVSHGKTTGGAWTTSGTQIAGAAGDELENANGDANFVSNTNIDDQLIWVSPNLLMNRMIAAGKLP